MGNLREIKAIDQAMKQTTNKRMYERYLAVRLRLEGQTLEQISKTLHRTRKTISGYIHKYQAGGLGALEMGHSPGKPPKLTKQQTRQLTEVLTHKRPVDVGFEAKYTWTLKLAIRYIEREFQQTFSVRGLSLLLHRLGFSYTKATYTLAAADPEEQRKFREETVTALKKSSWMEK